jgi:hypothetical protein
MNSGTLYNSNDPYKAYYLSVNHYLSVHEESNSMSSNDGSTQGRVYKPQDLPKLPALDTLIQWLPTWVYCILKGFGSLIGLALAIVLFGFALYFIIVHGSSLF